jgi:hypothetical protein
MTTMTGSAECGIYSNMNLTMKLNKRLGLDISKFKGQLTQDNDLMGRMNSILHIIPRIKQAIIKNDTFPKKERLRIILSLSKINNAVLKSKLAYYEHLKLTRRFTVHSNIICLIDDSEDIIAEYIRRLHFCGYDLTFFTDLLKPSIKEEIKKDDKRESK